MKCKLCNGDVHKVFSGKILSKFDTDYYFCPNCEFLQIQNPTWLDIAYSTAIAAQDTGVMKRNLNNSVLVAAIILSFFDINAKFLDYGGGYGVLTRLMRDIGFDFVWHDKYAKNLFSIGFEYQKSHKIELVTAFEVLEHLSFPFVELDEIFNIADNLLISEEIFEAPPPALNLWWYYAPESGQHISFYSKKTLNFIAEKFNKKLLSCGSYHLFTSKKIEEDDFINVVKNSAMIYARNASELKSKISQDMNYIISKNKK